MTSRRTQQDDAEAVAYYEESTNDSLYLPDAIEEKVVEKKFAMQTIEEKSNHHRWRNVTLVVILLACVITSTVIYLSIRDDEQKNSVERYETFAQMIEEALVIEMKNLRDVLRGLADTFMITAMSQNTSFPFVTVPMFEVVGGRAREQARGIEMLTFAPIVSETNKLKWNEYSMKEEAWLLESRKIVQARDDGSLLEASYQNTSIPKYIFGPQGRDKMASEAALYAPAWQSSPPPFDASSYINYNLLEEAFLDRMVHSVALAKDGLMSEIMPLAGLTSTSVSESTHTEFHQSFVTDVLRESYYEHPHSVFVQPVFSEMGNLDAVTSNLVGVIVAVVAWDRYLAHLLPSSVNGIHAVLSNTCGQHHTYIVNGPTASYLGHGDLHETKFDDTNKMFQLSQFDSSIANRIAGHCVYTLHLYSSTVFQDISTSQLGIAFGIATIFGIASAVVFGVMAMAFVVCDRCVRRRNAKATDELLDETLSSLFSMSHSKGVSEKPLKVTLTLHKATDSGDEEELKFGLVSQGLFSSS